MNKLDRAIDVARQRRYAQRMGDFLGDDEELLIILAEEVIRLRNKTKRK